MARNSAHSLLENLIFDLEVRCQATLKIVLDPRAQTVHVLQIARQVTSRLLKKDPECFEILSMNGKSTMILQ
jgi:hypothetical protein